MPETTWNIWKWTSQVIPREEKPKIISKSIDNLLLHVNSSQQFVVSHFLGSEVVPHEAPWLEWSSEGGFATMSFWPHLRSSCWWEGVSLVAIPRRRYRRRKVRRAAKVIRAFGWEEEAEFWTRHGFLKSASLDLAKTPVPSKGFLLPWWLLYP